MSMDLHIRARASLPGGDNEDKVEGKPIPEYKEAPHTVKSVSDTLYVSFTLLFFLLNPILAAFFSLFWIEHNSARMIYQNPSSTIMFYLSRSCLKILYPYFGLTENL